MGVRGKVLTVSKKDKKNIYGMSGEQI